jgi:hypothetical protein
LKTGLVWPIIIQERIQITAQFKTAAKLQGKSAAGIWKQVEKNFVAGP